MLMETESNLDFNGFLAEVCAAKIGYFSNRVQSDKIDRLFQTSSFFPPIFHLNPHTIWKYLTYLYFLSHIPQNYGVATFKMWLNQQVLSITLFIIELIEGLLLYILIAYNV